VGDNANHWLMIPLVDQCVAAGLTLAEPMLRVQDSADRSRAMRRQIRSGELLPTNLSVHYSLLADIWRQTKDLA
jgi:hypothetical protein